MKKTGIFYATATGTTEEVAMQIADLLGIDKSDVHNVAETAPTATGDYSALILGTSTWGSGDMEDSMIDFLDGLKVLDLTGKDVALFGCGDVNMSDTFCNAVGTLREELKDTGANFIGEFNVDGYEFESSSAVKDGKAVGLLIDNVNHEDMTPERLDLWCTEVKNQLAD